MTSASPAQTRPAAAGAAPRRPAGFGHLLLAEWTKIRSVRSTLWTLILLVLVSVGLTAGIISLLAANWSHASPQTRSMAAADPTGLILGFGLDFGQITICVLGVLVIASEYSTGVIRSSLLAAPRRAPMLAAKAVVLAAVVVVAGEVVAFASFLIGAAILRGDLAVSLSDPGVARAVAGAGLYLTVLALLSMAIGALIRHTAGAVTTAIGVAFVLPIITGFLPGNWGRHVNAYMPPVAGQMVAHTHQTATDVLSPWQGFGVFCLWTAVALAAAFWLLRRRDA